MNATTHEFRPEEVMAFLDGELSHERVAALSAHLETCAECPAVANNFRGLSAQVATWRVGQTPASLAEAPAGLQPGENASGKSLIGGASDWRPSSPFSWAVVSASSIFGLLLLIAIATPNLLRSRIAANESSAVGSLRTLNTATITYLDSYGHYPPSLKSLGPPPSGEPGDQAASLVDSLLADGKKSGYLFTYRSYPPSGASRAGTYTIHADPLNRDNGFRHFSTDQTGILYANGIKLDGDLFAEREKTVVADAAKVPQADLSAEPSPMIVRSAVLRLEVQKMSDARERLNQILLKRGGYIAQLSVMAEGNSQQTLVASLRVPVNQLNDSIAELKKLGRVVEETITGEEVTNQHRDLVARLNNARTTESKLNDVIQQHTGKVTDILEVEKESARVRGEIEQMEAEQKTLEHRVDFATIDLKLAEEYKAQLNTPAPSVLMQLRNASVNGFRNAFESLLSLVLFLAESGPSLLLWLALLGIPAWKLWKRYRRAQSLGSLAGA